MQEVQYRKELLTLTRRLRDDTNAQLLPQLKRLEPEYINDAYAKTLEQVFNNLELGYVGLNNQAQIVANEFTSRVNVANQKRFQNSVKSVVGIDLQSVVQTEGLTDILTATTRQNVSLIESIPEEYFKKLETIVWTETTQGSSASSMIDQITDLYKVTDNRARVIARDQTSKLNAALNQERQQSLGVEQYIWRTAEDERVRPSHEANDGKIFSYDDPPETGHPSHDVLCRCVAQAILPTF